MASYNYIDLSIVALDCLSNNNYTLLITQPSTKNNIIVVKK